jgi:diacylglycerol kinase family enzyme
MRSRVAVVLNAKSGGAGLNDELETVRCAFDDSELSAEFHIAHSGDNFEEVINYAVSNADIVVAAGGDGTVRSVAEAVVKTGKTLAVIPLGTLNHFSKDLNIPQDIAGAVNVIKNGSVTKIDIGEVNGHYFVNNSSIGLYPRIVRKRIQQERLGYGKWWSAAWAAWRLFVISPFLKTTLDLEGNLLHRKAAFIFVGNNDYEMDIYNIGRRPRLDQGKLSIYLLRRSGRVGLLLLILHTLTGRLKLLKDFEEFSAKSLSISTRRKRLLVALDGEVRAIETPLHYRIHPRALKVIAPEEKI